MKKVLALFLAVSMVLAYVPVPALAEETAHIHDAECGFLEENGSGCMYDQVQEEPDFPEETACTGEADCSAEEHGEDCAKKLADDRAAEEAAAKATEEPETVAEAAETLGGDCGDNLTWTLSPEGVLTVAGTGEMAGCPWADVKDQIVFVILEEGVTSIADSAFASCENLVSVTLPEGLTHIGAEAFSFCSRLSSIAMPDSVTTIGREAFCRCSNL